VRQKQEKIMKRILLAVSAATMLGLGVAPAFAAAPLDCNNLPYRAWAQCVIQQSIDRSGE
jgi:hypothetical protein